LPVTTQSIPWTGDAWPSIPNARTKPSQRSHSRISPCSHTRPAAGRRKPAGSCIPSVRNVYTPGGVRTICDATWSNARSVSNCANVYTDTGRQLDAETGLYYYRHRIYHSQLGRFASREPVGYRAGENLVEYVWDNPTTRTDPSGEQFVLGTPNSPWNPGPIESTPGPMLLPVRPSGEGPSACESTCFPRCLAANGTRWVICAVVGTTPVISLPLKPPGRPFGALTPAWSNLLRAGGGKGQRVIERRLNPWGNVICVAGVSYTAGTLVSCSCICALDPNAY
jgi:RHS repeat-associated protein